MPIQPNKSLIDSFNETNLDLENSNPQGGPNRTNSSNIPTGQYLNKSTHNITDELGGVVLKEKNGKNLITQLNRWTPTNTYLESKDWENKYPIEPNNNKNQNLPSITLPPKVKNLLGDVKNWVSNASSDVVGAFKKL